MREKEKIFVVSIFSYSLTVFRRRLSRVIEHPRFFGTGLKDFLLSLVKNVIVIFGSLNSFPNKPLFLHVCSESLMKIWWKKENACYEQFFLFQVVLPF